MTNRSLDIAEKMKKKKMPVVWKGWRNFDRVVSYRVQYEWDFREKSSSNHFQNETYFLLFVIFIVIVFQIGEGTL